MPTRRSNLCCVTDDFDKFFEPVFNRLKDVYVENLDFKDIVKRYDIRETNKEEQSTLFYFDPPYYDTKEYKDKFTLDDHYDLSEMCKKLKGDFILTINSHDEIKELYKEFNFVENEVNYSLSKDTNGMGKRKELIITNYDVKLT